MRLSIQYPVFDQIQKAVENNVPLYFDLRKEAMGDKAAALSVLEWFSNKGITDFTVLEAPNGRTPFMLSDYNLPYRFKLKDADEPIDGLDIHTAGNNDSLWVLNPYLATIGIHPKLPMNVAATDEIVFCALTDVEYNERREMDIDCIRNTIDYLRSEGLNVALISDSADPRLGDKLDLTFNECIMRQAAAKCVIAGDTGFAHVAAALGKPVISIMWDMYLHGVAKLDDCVRTSEWFGIPTHYTAKSFLPNTNNGAVVLMGSDHTWSLEHVLKSVKRIGFGSHS